MEHSEPKVYFTATTSTGSRIHAADPERRGRALCKTPIRFKSRVQRFVYATVSEETNCGNCTAKAREMGLLSV